MKYCTNCVSPSSAPLPGKTSSNGCYYALRQNKNIISASNSSPSHSLPLESFAQVKTCNQFDRFLTRLLGLGYLMTWHVGRRAFCGVRLERLVRGHSLRTCSKSFSLKP